VTQFTNDTIRSLFRQQIIKKLALTRRPEPIWPMRLVLALTDPRGEIFSRGKGMSPGGLSTITRTDRM